MVTSCLDQPIEDRHRRRSPNKSTDVDICIPVAFVNICWHLIRMPDRPNQSAGKTPKSQRTRAAILQAAQELFATQGYERTTVRDVAARAAIDPAMVMRYFGSKEGLFARA